MNEVQERRLLDLHAQVRDFWERRYEAVKAGTEDRRQWASPSKCADADCRDWWKRFGDGLPMPQFLCEPSEQFTRETGDLKLTQRWLRFTTSNDFST